MAIDRYWRGGNCNDTANWNSVQGGAGGASLPTSTSNVGMDLINPVSATATINATMNCADLDFTGFTGTFAGSSGLNVYGKLDMSTGMTRTYTGALTLRATSGTKTITTNGKTLTYIAFNGNGGTFQLLDDITLQAADVSFTRNFGTIDTNGKTVTLMITSGQANILGDFTGTSCFYNLTISGGTSKTGGTTFSNSITVTNDLVINGNSSINRLLVKSDTVGTSRTTTCNGTLTVTNADFQDITGAGAGSWNLSAITGLSGDCGGNSGITFTTPVTTTCSSGTTWSTATWSSRVPLPQDSATFSGSSRTITQDMPRIGSVDFTDSSGLTWTTSTACSVYGSINLTDLGTLTASTQAYTFMGRGSYNLTSAGKTWNKSFTINAPSGTLTLQDDLTLGYSLTITAGTFNANNCNITVAASFTITGSSVRSVVMGSGIWSCGDTGNAWSCGTTTNLTLNAGTSTIKLINNSTSAKTFAGGGLTYYNLWNATQGTGTFTITGSNTFNQLKTDTGRTTILTASTTTKISSIDMVGATLQSTSSTDAILDLQNLVKLSALSGITLTDITVINPKPFTAKTDWTSSDYINIADLNRIEENTQEISDLLATFSATPTLGTVKTTWAITDFPYYDELNRIESNVLALKTAFYEPVGWITPVTSWVTGPIGSGYVMANRIETDLLLLYNLATDAKNYLQYCGQFYAGQDNTYL